MGKRIRTWLALLAPLHSDMGQEAGCQSFEAYLKNPAQTKWDSNVDGVNFRGISISIPRWGRP